MTRLRPLALVFVLVLAAAALPVAAAAAPAVAPSGFRISINGKTLTAAQLSDAADTYVNVPAGPLSIGVRWVTDLRGTGHRVVITSPGGSARRICVSGTSCVLAPARPLAKGAETSWSVQIYRNGRLVSNKVLCLTGV